MTKMQSQFRLFCRQFVWQSRSPAFTLVELLIIITIIGILAVVVIPKFLNLRREAQNAAAQANIGALRSSIAMYYYRSATPSGQCLCLASSTPGSCNSYRAVDTIWPCYPYNINELESLLAANIIWPYNGSGACYNSTTGAVMPCPS